MVETRPAGSSFGTSIGGPVNDGQRSGAITGIAAVERLPPRGRPGNRWPSARELAALMVNGILRLPARYRRGMFLDVLS